MLPRIKRLLVGQPLSSHGASHEKISKWKALSTLSSDALSSVAYAGDEILIVLMAAGAAALTWSLPIAFGVIILLTILTASYRQTIEAYPSGGGAYTVAKDNLGTNAGLIAGASLLIDYILTVAVSVSAGIENIISAFPLLDEHRIIACAVVIILITIMNLRGIRESATIFAFPTYFFILSIFALVGVGLWKIFTGQEVAAAPLIHNTYPAVPVILILRAFASGCAALTGIEAISNGVSIFKAPATRNAKITMTWMAVLLGALFLGITVIAHTYGLAPHEGQTLISNLGSRIFGKTAPYYMIQVSTALILFLAANTSYAGFPTLASILAKDRFLPRQLTSVGDRLVFSNGILGLSAVAFLLVALFKANTHHLIPLYAVGVFLSFTLSQAGMVLHHMRHKEENWLRSLIINLLGAIATLVVLIDITYTKFAHGAWMVVLTIPCFVMLFKKINTHYLSVGKELSVIHEAPPARFEPIKHTVIIPISGIHRGVLEAIRYAISISHDVRACYVEIDSETTQRIKVEWKKWAPQIPFVVLKSPYRSVIQPLIKYIDDVEEVSHDDLVTVVVPEFVTSKWWHRLLHNQTALFIRAALLFKRNKVVTSVRYHLNEV